MQIDYPLTMHKAERLDELTQRLNRMRADLTQFVTYGQSGWKGEAATAYFKSCIEFDEKIKKVAIRIDTLSSTIRSTAEALMGASCPENVAIPDSPPCPGLPSISNGPDFTKSPSGL